MSAYSKFYIRPQNGELITTAVKLSPDSMSAICGRVMDKDGKAIDNAAVLLSRASRDDKASPEASFFTDEDGQFFFGPLESDVLYIIRIFKNDIKLRELEIIAE